MSNPFYGMDEFSAALAIQLLLEDSENLSASSKGKHKEGEFSDAELALASYKSDLLQTSRAIADRRMTRSISVAVEIDGNVLTEFLSQEQEAGTDRELALRLGGHKVSRANPPQKALSTEIDVELLTKFSQTKAGDIDEDLDEPVSTGFGGPYRWSKKRRCTACQDFVEYSKLARAPCMHEYCEDCLRSLFESSTTDESLFPPRCCKQPIPVASVRIFLTPELIRKYEQKKIEFGTANRTYCSSSRCSTFININNIKGDQGTCPDCALVTCTICKAAAHKGDCPADTDLQLVLATAAENGWQRCYSCRRLLELDTGCNHMTCTCNAQFCYICGEQWKTCACPQWNEDRLLCRATQIVARQPRAAGPLPVDQIFEEMQNLRDRHNCDHDSWRYINGRHQCEECRFTLPSYIFECNQCRIRACNRCRRNRL